MSRAGTKVVVAPRPKRPFRSPSTGSNRPLTGRGKIEDGQLVLTKPVAIPDGTKVVVTIELVRSPKAPKPTKAKKPRHLTQEELSEFAKRHPPPREWWDATDNPFEP